MSDTEILWFVGLDWGSETHRVSLFDRTGALVGRRDVAHSGPAYGALCEWLLRTTQAAPGQIGVAIETSHGPVVDALLERGFQLYAINPKQLDKFRDRYSMAGAKDDTRDADTLGRCLRTDRDAFRPLSLTHPLLVQLRGATRLAEELTRTHGRLASQLREQLWRYYPQILALADDVADAWLLDLWRLAPTPAKGAKLHKETIARLLKPHRIRRLDADQVRQVLREPALPVAPGAAGDRCPVRRLRRTQGQPRGYISGGYISGRHISGAEFRAARRGDPALLAGNRSDQPRHAARRGLPAPATTRLPRPARPVWRRPRHPPQRQELHRAATIGLQQAAGQCALSLGPRRHAARSCQSGPISRAAPARTVSWAGLAHRRRSVAGTRLHLAPTPGPVRSQPPRTDRSGAGGRVIPSPGMLLGSARVPLLRPSLTPQPRRAQAGSRRAEGHRARAARSVLDHAEHGATLQERPGASEIKACQKGEKSMHLLDTIRP
jgi:hypothetical protein